jgi:FtsP/CotA-like multicopper oxidase with cupredoxin domain
MEVAAGSTPSIFTGTSGEILRRAINGTVTPLAPTQLGLKDVFVLEAGETLSVITKYTGADKVGNYVMHCHNLEHEDMAMMIVWDVAV